MISGCIGAEIYKVTQGFKDIESYKNWVINLALPLLDFTQPNTVLKNKSKDFDPTEGCPIKAIPEDFTIYDKIVVQGSMTLEELMKSLKEKYQIQIVGVFCDNMMYYNKFNKGHNERLSKTPEEIHEQILKKKIIENRKYLALQITGEVLN